MCWHEEQYNPLEKKCIKKSGQHLLTIDSLQTPNYSTPDFKNLSLCIMISMSL